MLRSGKQCTIVGVCSGASVAAPSKYVVLRIRDGEDGARRWHPGEDCQLLAEADRDLCSLACVKPLKPAPAAAARGGSPTLDPVAFTLPATAPVPRDFDVSVRMSAEAKPVSLRGKAIACSTAMLATVGLRPGQRMRRSGVDCTVIGVCPAASALAPADTGDFVVLRVRDGEDGAVARAAACS